MENKKNNGKFDYYLEIVQNIFIKLEQKNFDLFSFDKDLISLDELISKIEE